MKIGIIGAGNLGKAIIDGLISKNMLFSVSDRFEKSYRGISILDNNKEVAEKSDIIILTVKPSDLDSLLSEIKEATGKKTVISFAAGVKLSYYEKRTDAKLVRAMTNLAVRECSGFIMYKCSRCNASDKEKIQEIFSMLGVATETKEEALLDASTAMSGSGIAYLVKIFQCFIDNAAKSGFLGDAAKDMVLQTVIGATALLKKDRAQDIISKVASKGGTTEKGLLVMKNSNIEGLLEKVIEMTLLKCRNIGDQYE